MRHALELSMNSINRHYFSSELQAEYDLDVRNMSRRFILGV
jgi:hypothetical protein